MHALILADGEAPTRFSLDATWPGWSDGVALVIAADGGARLADPLGMRLDLWVGDGDSLGAEAMARLADAGVPMERAATDKDESDTELAVFAALARGASRITILGGLGGPRFDHALANVGLLALDGLVGLDVRLVGTSARVRLLRAPGPDGAPVTLGLDGHVGDTVSLLPSGGHATGVTTAGLHYPLRDEVLSDGHARGLSNIREEPSASVTARAGRLIVIESPASL